MTTPHLYLIQPDGERYNNVKKIGGTELIINTTRDETDYKHTNRVGIVIAVPRAKGCLEVGDKVIVHHNTFRKWFNVKGNLKDSANYVRKDQFNVGLDQIFAFKRGDIGWESLEDYCFIEADKEEGNAFLTAMRKEYSETTGKVHIANRALKEQGVAEGDRVLFQEEAAYRFEIDGKMLYKMSTRNIQALL